MNKNNENVNRNIYKESLSDDAVNRLIAEYMGWRYCSTHSPSPVFTHEEFHWQYPEYFKYTKSLDALVKVWEKAKIGGRLLPVIYNGVSGFYFFVDRFGGYIDPAYKGFGETIQQAAAHATAKAIQELANGK